MLMFLLLAAAPHKHELALAIEGLLAGDPGAARRLEVLHERRPWDDDVAFWLARARLEGQRCEEARTLVLGRDGKAWPEASLRVVEGLALACLGRGEEAVEALARAPELHLGEPLRDQGLAVLALLLAPEEPARAQELLTALPGSSSAAAAWLEPRLGGPLAGLPNPTERQLLLEVEDGAWALGQDGLARPTEAPEPSPVRCEGRTWALTSQGLVSEGEVVQFPVAGVADLQVACVDESLLVLRMAPTGSLLSNLEGEEVPLGGRTVLSVSGSASDLLVVALEEDERRSLWWSRGGGELERLHTGELALRDARWLD